MYRNFVLFCLFVMLGLSCTNYRERILLKKNARAGLKVREAIEYMRLRTDTQAEVTITGYLVGSRQVGKDIFLQLAEDKGQIASAFNCYCRFELKQQPAIQSIAQNTAITVSGKLGETTQGITLTDCQLIMINNEGKDMYLPLNTVNY